MFYKTRACLKSNIDWAVLFFSIFIFVVFIVCPIVYNINALVGIVLIVSGVFLILAIRLLWTVQILFWEYTQWLRDNGYLSKHYVEYEFNKDKIYFIDERMKGRTRLVRLCIENGKLMLKLDEPLKQQNNFGRA